MKLLQKQLGPTILVLFYSLCFIGLELYPIIRCCLKLIDYVIILMSIPTFSLFILAKFKKPGYIPKFRHKLYELKQEQENLQKVDIEVVKKMQLEILVAQQDEESNEREKDQKVSFSNLSEQHDQQEQNVESGLTSNKYRSSPNHLLKDTELEIECRYGKQISLDCGTIHNVDECQVVRSKTVPDSCQKKPKDFPQPKFLKLQQHDYIIEINNQQQFKQKIISQRFQNPTLVDTQVVQNTNMVTETQFNKLKFNQQVINYIQDKTQLAESGWCFNFAHKKVIDPQIELKQISSQNLKEQNQGEIHNNNQKQEQQINSDELEPQKIEKRYCIKCDNEQPLRAKHCSFCKKCIPLYDHHCPWMGACIGEKNKFCYLIYLLMQDIHLALAIVKASDIIRQQKGNHLDIIFWAGIILLIIISLLFLALCVLTSYQFFYISKNITTWEYMSWEKISYLQNLNRNIQSPFNRGTLANFKIFLSYSFSSKIYQWSYVKENY